MVKSINQKAGSVQIGDKLLLCGNDISDSSNPNSIITLLAKIIKNPSDSKKK